MRISARTTLHLLDSNEDLTPDEYVRARALIDEVQLLHRGAAQFVAAAGLDREVFLPGNIWADLHARAMHSLNDPGLAPSVLLSVSDWLVLRKH